MKAARGRQTAFSEGKVVLNSLLPRKECDEMRQLLVDVKLKFFMGFYGDVSFSDSSLKREMTLPVGPSYLILNQFLNL